MKFHLRFGRLFSVESVAETGNTEVTPPVSISILRGCDPGRAGFAPRAIDMTENRMTVSAPSFAQRNAVRAAAMFAALLMVVVLAMPTVNRVSAAETQLQAVFGSVVAVTLPDTLAIATNSGVVKLVITEDSVFTGEITSLDEVSEGDRVVATAYGAPDDTLTVGRLLIIPDLSRTVTRHILGVIVDAQDDVVMLQDGDGNAITIYVPAGVDSPQVGTVVTVVVQVDRSTGRLTAQAFERVEDAVKRLQDAADRATDAELKKELEKRLEKARDQHLTALEKARAALQRAQEAVSAAVSQREEAQRRLAEVQAKFEALRQRYVQEASDRNERQPQLLITGTLSYDERHWLDEAGTFTIIPDTAAGYAGDSQEFAWDATTLAIVPVEVQQPDGDSPAITSVTAQSVAVALNDVKSLIPPGSRVTVQYDPNVTPLLATLVTVLPPELSDEVVAALERERVRSITGVITLAEDTPNLDGAIGVIVVANNQHNVKVAAKVTEQTDVEIDGQPAKFSQLAAGMAVEVDFSNDASPDSQGAAAVETTNRTAVAIRARTVVSEHEAYVSGVIVTTNPDARAVAVLPSSGDVVRARVLNDAVIVKDGVQVRFADLAVGDLVLDATRYNRDSMVFTRLLVRSPRANSFSGTITGVGHSPDRLTVASSNGDVLTVFIVGETKIHGGDGEPVKFGELLIGDRIVQGSMQPVVRDGRSMNVARELVLGQPVFAVARGKVLRVSDGSGMVRMSVTADSTDGLSTELELYLAERQRSVLTKNGERIEDLSTVQVGDIIESVSYRTATRTIIKMVVTSPNLQRIRGAVSSVASQGLVIEGSNGRFVGLSVDSATKITLNGVRVDSLRDVKTRQIVVEAVYIARSSDLTEGLALRIVLIDRPSTSEGATPPTAAAGTGSVVETTVSGVIKSIDDGNWVIGDHKFIVNGGTQFFGERPQVGLVAKASLRVKDSGEFVATAVSVAGRPDSNPTTRPADVKPTQPGDSTENSGSEGLVRILGKVQKIDTSTDGQTVVVIDGVKILLLASTVVVGDPVEGVTALAVVRRNASGSVTAVTIVFGRSPSTTVAEPASPAISGDSSSGSSPGAVSD
jgi:hypothetical protein